jgi:hypothetical protein
MRRLLGLAVVGATLALGATFAVGADAPKNPAEAPKSRADWPTEKVLVIGRRGNPRDWFVNHTFRGMEGFADGSAPPGVEARSEYPFQIYYAANGKLEAHFRRLGTRAPHAAIEEVDYVEYGTWRINEEGDLCQTIPKVGWGTEVCYWFDRKGDRMALYYTTCGAFNRCYPGRLGPEGEIVPGKQFTR